jgi:hypothetical protein
MVRAALVQVVGAQQTLGHKGPMVHSRQDTPLAGRVQSPDLQTRTQAPPPAAARTAAARAGPRPAWGSWRAPGACRASGAPGAAPAARAPGASRAAGAPGTGLRARAPGAGLAVGAPGRMSPAAGAPGTARTAGEPAGARPAGGAPGTAWAAAAGWPDAARAPRWSAGGRLGPRPAAAAAALRAARLQAQKGWEGGGRAVGGVRAQWEAAGEPMGNRRQRGKPCRQLVRSKQSFLA